MVSFDNPKSVNLAYPSLSMSTFSGFRLFEKNSFLKFLLSVDDTMLVKALEGQEYIRCVELGAGLFEATYFRNVKEEFSPGAVVEN